MCFATLLLFPRRLTTSSTGIALTLVKGASQGEGLTLACQSPDGREIDGQVWMVTVSSPGLLLSSNSTPDSCYGSHLIATLGPLSSANPHSASTCQLSDRLTPGMVRPVCAGSQPQQPERVGAHSSSYTLLREGAESRLPELEVTVICSCLHTIVILPTTSLPCNLLTPILPHFITF